MATLSPQLAAARRGLDYRATMPMTSPVLGSLAAFGAGSKTPVTHEEGERGKATVYLVSYSLKFLTGPGAFADRVDVRIDLGLSTDYPFTPPDVTVVSRPKPWSPHVLSSSGSVCIGEIWENAGGKMLVAHLVTHVAKVLNCDEPDRGPTYVGWNAAAVAYWRTVMKREPITKGLMYPLPPPEITHGVSPGTELGRMPGSGLSTLRTEGGGLRRAAAGLAKTQGGRS